MSKYTQSQINSFNTYQYSGVFHPFTCGANECREILLAKESGLYCPKCDYVQYWCHDWMLDWEWCKASWDERIQKLHPDYKEPKEENTEVYCNDCGSCGEPGCCSAKKCKYFDNYLEDYMYYQTEVEKLSKIVEDQKNTINFLTDRLEQLDK